MTEGLSIGTDLAQWVVIVSFLVGISTLVFNIRQRDRERDAERDAVTVWRTNTERDVELLKVNQEHDSKLLTDKLQRLQGHDDRIFDKIDVVLTEIRAISERLVHLESYRDGKGS